MTQHTPTPFVPSPLTGQESLEKLEAVSIRNLTKIYPRPTNLLQLFLSKRKRGGKPEALIDVDLTILGGESFGIVGKNGSGKTTLLKTIASLIFPTRGSLRVFGHETIEDEKTVKQRIGYVPADERSFFWRLSCYENLFFFGSLYGMDRRQLHHRIEVLTGELSMASFIRERFDTISSGKKQLLSIARGVLIDPDLLIVDEPTRSLDLETALRVRAYLKKQVNDRGRTLIIASHQIEDIDHLCHRVAILEAGRILNVLTRDPAGHSLAPSILDYFTPERNETQTPL